MRLRADELLITFDNEAAASSEGEKPKDDKANKATPAPPKP